MANLPIDPSVANVIVAQGESMARRLCAGRVRATGNAALRFDSLPASEQLQMLNMGILLSDHGLNACFRGKGQEIADAYRLDAAKGKAWGLSDYAIRMDAAGVSDGGHSDLESVFTVTKMYKDLVQPNVGLDFLPLYQGIPMGAMSVRVRRGSVTGEHGPIGDTVDMTPVGFTHNSDTRNLTWEGSLAAVFMPGQVDAEYAGVNVLQEKRMGLAQVLEERRHDLCWTGDADTGALGLVDPGNGCEIRVEPTSIAYTSPSTLVALIMEHAVSMMRQSGGAFIPDTLLVSHNVMGSLSLQYGTDGDKLAIVALEEGLSRLIGKPITIKVWRKLDPSTDNRRGVLNNALYTSAEMFLFLDASKGNDGPSRLSLGPIIVPENVGLQTRIFQLTKEGGVHCPEPTAIRLVAFTMTGAPGE